MTDDLLLVGLDGSNPLAFLTAMGTLQTLADAWPDRNVRLGWQLQGRMASICQDCRQPDC